MTRVEELKLKFSMSHLLFPKTHPPIFCHWAGLAAFNYFFFYHVSSNINTKIKNRNSGKRRVVHENKLKDPQTFFMKFLKVEREIL